MGFGRANIQTHNSAEQQQQQQQNKQKQTNKLRTDCYYYYKQFAINVSQMNVSATILHTYCGKILETGQKEDERGARTHWVSNRIEIPGNHFHAHIKSFASLANETNDTHIRYTNEFVLIAWIQRAKWQQETETERGKMRMSMCERHQNIYLFVILFNLPNVHACVQEPHDTNGIRYRR